MALTSYRCAGLGWGQPYWENGRPVRDTTLTPSGLPKGSFLTHLSASPWGQMRTMSATPTSTQAALESLHQRLVAEDPAYIVVVARASELVATDVDWWYPYPSCLFFHNDGPRSVWAWRSGFRRTRVFVRAFQASEVADRLTALRAIPRLGSGPGHFNIFNALFPTPRWTDVCAPARPSADVLQRYATATPLPARSVDRPVRRFTGTRNSLPQAERLRLTATPATRTASHAQRQENTTLAGPAPDLVHRTTPGLGFAPFRSVPDDTRDLLPGRTPDQEVDHSSERCPVYSQTLPNCRLASPDADRPYDLPPEEPTRFSVVGLPFPTLQRGDVLQMDALADDSGVRVADLDLLTPDEPAATHPAEETRPVPAATLADSIAAQVARTPDATAVVRDGMTTLTYAELDARAAELAVRLWARGVGRGQLVAVAVPSSAELMMAVLGVLKAGAAYLLLGLGYPAERLVYMLAGSGATTVVTTERDAARLPPVDGLDVLRVDATDTAGAAGDDAPSGPSVELPDPVRPGDLAYIYYTSGSTGRPKGVVVTQRAIGNWLAWMQGVYQLASDERVLQRAPSSFDVGVGEFFWALREGAGVVLAAPDRHRAPADTVWAGNLRHVLGSGKALSGTDVLLRNLDGPTEAAVDVTYHAYDGTSDTTVPIGLRVLDTCLRPVPGEPVAVAAPVPDRLVDHAARRFTDARNRLWRAARLHPATPAACTRAHAQTRRNTILAGAVSGHVPTAERCPGSPPGHPDRCVHRMVPTAKGPRCRPTRKIPPGSWPCVLTGPGPHATVPRADGPSPADRRDPTRRPLSRRPGTGIPVPAAGQRIQPRFRSAAPPAGPYRASPSTVSSSARR